MAKQALEGIKVLDFSWIGAGPQVGRELAEHGATVVRVECHRRPDGLRAVAPFKDGIPGINRSGFGAAYNTNKLSVSLDLTYPKGPEIARRMVAWADVVADSMAPGALAKFGLDYEGCRKIKPDIIYYSTCQMGQKGPLASFAGYGLFAISYAGHCHLTGWPDRPPNVLFNYYSDMVAPFYLGAQVAAAIARRRRTGKGMYLDQSQVEVGVGLLGPAMMDYMINGRVAQRMGNRDPYMAPHGIYPCLGEDRWIAISVADEEAWKRFCRSAGHPEWSADPKFDTLINRKKYEEALDHTISQWTRQHSAEGIMELLQEEGIAAGVVKTGEDLFADPQLKHREHFRRLEHQEIGLHAYHAPSYKLSKTPADVRRAAPTLGQDNEYVFKELIGLSDDEIADLLIDGTITTEHDVMDALKGSPPSKKAP